MAVDATAATGFSLDGKTIPLKRFDEDANGRVSK